MAFALFRRWWFSTLLVLAACGVMVRLGIWQLDRLDQRRQFNTRVQTQLEQPVLQLAGDRLEENLVEMEYRSVVVVGQYQYSDEVALRNQVNGNQPGIHLITPLIIEGSDLAVLVDRGWIPAEDAAPERWSDYQQPGTVEVQGVIRRSTTRPDVGRRTDPILSPDEGPLLVWNLLNVERIAAQSSNALLPIYIHQDAGPIQPGLPVPAEIELDLSEGPHLGYAGQWFMFAFILAVGYPVYVYRQETTRVQGSVGSETVREIDTMAKRPGRIQISPQPTKYSENILHD